MSRSSHRWAVKLPLVGRCWRQGEVYLYHLFDSWAINFQISIGEAKKSGVIRYIYICIFKIRWWVIAQNELHNYLNVRRHKEMIWPACVGYTPLEQRFGKRYRLVRTRMSHISTICSSAVSCMELLISESCSSGIYWFDLFGLPSCIYQLSYQVQTSLWNFQT